MKESIQTTGVNERVATVGNGAVRVSVRECDGMHEKTVGKCDMQSRLDEANQAILRGIFVFQAAR